MKGLVGKVEISGVAGVGAACQSGGWGLMGANTVLSAALLGQSAGCCGSNFMSTQHDTCMYVCMYIACSALCLSCLSIACSALCLGCLSLLRPVSRLQSHPCCALLCLHAPSPPATLPTQACWLTWPTSCLSPWPVTWTASAAHCHLPWARVATALLLAPAPPAGGPAALPPPHPTAQVTAGPTTARALAPAQATAHLPAVPPCLPVSWASSRCVGLCVIGLCEQGCGYTCGLSILRCVLNRLGSS